MRTNKSIIAGIILVATLLGACIYGFLQMKRQAYPVDSSAIFCVVPPDALVVQRFRTFEDLCETYVSEDAMMSRFCAPNNGLFRLLNAMSDAENVFPKLFRAESIFSVHYTGKNNLQVLLGVQFLEGHAFEKFCQELGGATLHKSYNKVDIYQLFEASSWVYVAITDDFLLVGTSPVVVESSIRHLKSGRSLMDNQAFASVRTFSSAISESSVYVNARQFDKLFGSLLGRRMQRHADFFSKSASWIALDGTTTGDLVHLNGYIQVDKGDADYFASIRSQTPASVKTWEVLPASTLAFFSFSLSNFSQYQNQYGNFLEIHKKNKRAAAQVQAWEAGSQTKLNEWFEALCPAEVALAWVPISGKNQWVSLVRSQQIQQARKHIGYAPADPKQPQVFPNEAAGALSVLFGPFFDRSPESHYTIIDNTLFFGSEELLGAIIAGNNKTPSLHSTMRQGRIRGKWMEETCFTCVLQGAEARDSLLNMCDARFVPMIKKALTPYSHVWTIFQVSSIGGKPYANLLLSGDNPRQTTSSARASSREASEREVIPMAVGSFKIFNHASRKNEEIEQKTDSTLVLKDASGKQVWRTRRKYAIVDEVVQIDYFKNDKLQMLFASGGNELCLLDILGRLVAPYPKTVPIPVRKGPYLFERNTNREYEIFLIHTDNSLRLYNKDGVEVPGWKTFIPDDRIEQKPVLLKSQGGHYWLVTGAQKDYILNPQGAIEIVLQRRNRIKHGADIQIDANGVLQSVTTEGRILTVQLNTGTIKTRKP
ncbi:MAG: DUF3352 domain-containing protein [Bacteroidales bacterium]|nr:DUF3352 domain-containing protein [Bacteroidales bacterium]